MYHKKNNGFSSKKITRFLIRNSNILMGCLILVTLLLMIPAVQVKIDTSGVTFKAAGSGEYADYLLFVESFGTDDYILLATQNSLALNHPELKKRVYSVHEDLISMDCVLQVIDLGVMESSGFFKQAGISDLLNEKKVTEFRKIIPGLNRLISTDMETLAFIVKIDNERFNGFQLERQLAVMKQIVEAAFPEHPHCYAAGIPVLRAAFERYNLMSALVFGLLGLLFGTLIAFYIFKTLWAGIMVMFVSLASVVWTLGIMGIFNVAVNLATGLSFGFILVVATTTVFHIVSKYSQLKRKYSTGISIKKTFEIILRPCFMCSLTTSTGFLSLMISPVPMVCQAGVIISVGVMMAFLLTIIVTAFFLPKFLVFNETVSNRSENDAIDWMVKRYLVKGFKNPGISVLIGILFFAGMVSGIPGIKSVRHLTDPMIKNTREALDINFIQQHLSTGYSFSLIIHSTDNIFESRKFWYDLYLFEKKINAIQGVQNIESITPFVFKTARQFPVFGIRPEFVFHQMVSRDADNEMLKSYIDPVLKKLRIIIHIQNQSSDQIETIISQVKKEVKISFAHPVDFKLAGQLILLKSQTMALVSSQLKTLCLTLFVITFLMIFQLKSFVLGLLSLIPNLFPLITVFGIMGWLNIPLDPLTIFAAVISFGLSVDDSIHYLTQLNREMSNPKRGSSLQDCLKNAYDSTSRALFSTTTVLFLSSTGLLFSSFKHVSSLGLLIASASLVALVADLIFIPAVILKFQPFYNALSHRMGYITDLNNEEQK